MRNLLILVALFWSNAAFADDLEISATTIETFKPGSNQTRFGALEFLGGLVLTSDHTEFGGLSGIRFDGDGRAVMVTDKARVITADLARDGTRPAALNNARITRIKATNGRTITGAGDKDAEALEIAGSSYFVGFERNDRVMRFTRKADALVADPGYLVDFNPESFPDNKGAEAAALDPKSGNLFVFAELALDENGDHRGYVISRGKVIKNLTVTMRNGFSLTDAAFLPDGDLILLERYFNPFTGVFMRMRRIKSETIASGDVLDGEILIDVSYSHEIDNMEGLAIGPIDAGRTRLTIVSDDNFSARQRTLLLEFMLED
ncbi:MAG: esterase-like activity of phytase family protein [Pseudomonadota bacterium]